MMKTNRQSEKKGKKFRNLLFWAGFLICIFPVISNIIERQRQADAVATYRQTMEKEDEKALQTLLDNGMEYNELSDENREKFIEVSKSCYGKFKELINDDELFDKTAEFCGKSE